MRAQYSEFHKDYDSDEISMMSMSNVNAFERFTLTPIDGAGSKVAQMLKYSFAIVLTNLRIFF